MATKRDPNRDDGLTFYVQPQPWSPPPPPVQRALPGPMDVHPTEIAYRRLGRARAHLDALEHEVRVYIESEPFETFIDEDLEQGRYFVRVKVRREPPDALGLIAGDVIHNMRATLDNLVWHFARRHEDPPANQSLAFPTLLIRDPPPKVAGQPRPKSWAIEGVKAMSSVADDVAAVIERFQPFVTQQGDPRQDLLWILNRLWNDDKHQGTIAAGGSTARNVMRASLIRAIGGLNGPYFLNDTFQDGDVIAGIDYNPTGYFEGDPEFSFAHYVAFRRDGTAGNKMFWDFLVEIYNYLLLDVVPAFEGL